MGHIGVSDIESSSVSDSDPLNPRKRSHGNPSNMQKNAYVVLLEVACTLSNSLNVQQF